MSSAVAFFNNKGGVGKTTLACNFAAFAAANGQRVLVIDLDPQCNSTQLILTDDQWTEIYEDAEESEAKTVMSVLRIIRSGDSAVDADSMTVWRSERFGVDVLAGHPSLSIFEDILSEAWTKFRGGEVGGARKSNWLRTLRKEAMDDHYDVVVVDVSPSLGALNRSALIGSDSFVTPAAADLFSLYAMDNITGWFQRWLKDFASGRANAADELRATGFEDLLPEPLPIESGFIGYTVQQYVSRTSGGEVRQIQAYDKHRNQIPERAKSLIELSRYSSGLELGIVPNMFSMIPLAQTQHAPIAGLVTKDGLRGSQLSQQQRYAEQLTNIFSAIAERVADSRSS